MPHENINIGDVVTVAGIEWIVLDKREQVIMCLTKNLVDTRKQFDTNTNNYTTSTIRRYLSIDFLQRITNAIGENALREVKIDLTTLDALDDYEYVTDKVGLLTFDMYRYYNHIIERYEVGQSWWLATAWTTQHRSDNKSVCMVDEWGVVDPLYCDSHRAIRPFCIFDLSSLNL